MFNFCTLLDVINTISFHKLNLIKLSNPIKFMTMHAFEVEGQSGIMVKIRAILQAVLGNLEISAEFNENYNPTILGIDTKIFFRSLHLIIFFSLILISSLIIRKNFDIFIRSVFYWYINLFFNIYIKRNFWI